MACGVRVVILSASIALAAPNACGQAGSPSCQAAHEILRSAQNDTRQVETARKQFEACVSQGLPGFQDLVDLGDIYSQLGRYADGIGTYQHALALNPQSAEARMKLGRALVQSYRYPEAVRELGRTLVLEPDNHRAEDLLAMSLFQMKQYELAALAAKHVHEAKPEEASATFILGSCYLRMQLYTKAIPLLQAALAKTGSAEIRAILGEAYVGLRAYRQALNEFLEAEKVNPRIQGLHSETGAAYAAIGQTDRALAEYQQALQLDPNDFAANYFLGRINRLRGDYQKAQEFLAKANQTNPNDPSVLFEYAVLAVNDKDYSKAESLLRQVLDKLPDYVDAHVMLSNIYFKTRRNDEAKREKAIADVLQKAQQERQRAANTGQVYGGSLGGNPNPR